MRWFKHFTDNHRGRSVQDLLDQLGHTGLCYFLLMELCAEKLERKPDKCVEDSDCLFRFHTRVVRQMLRISSANLGRLLDICAANGLLSFKFSGSEVEINMPMLLDLLDYDSKKSRHKRDSVVPESRLDIDTDTESDKETDTDTEPYIAKKPVVRKKPTKSLPAVDNKASALVAHYCECFKHRHKVNPSVSKADAKILKDLFCDMGIERAKILILAYFTMPDAYVAKAKHPIKLLSYKINEVLVYAETGNFITNSQIRAADIAMGNELVIQKMINNEAQT